jgi:hypothetical protein
MVHKISAREIAKPNCPKCGVEMWLLHIDPQLSCDRLTFECARCNAQEHREVAPGRGLLKTRAAT